MKIFIVHANAGAGHRKAAEALYKAFSDEKIADLKVEKIDVLDHTNLLFKKAYPGVYIFLVKYLPFLWGWFFHLLNIAVLKSFIGVIRHAFNSFHGKKIIDYVIRESPDAVICEHFLSAELISYLKKKNKFHGLVVCGVTDFGVHQFWVNLGTDFYLVASELTKKELAAKGVPIEKIFVFGIPIEQKFSKSISKNEARKKLGLAEDKFTVLVTSGGFGVGPIKKIVSLLDAFGADIQAAVICGSNEALVSYFKNQTFRKNIKIFGYIHNMDEFMDAADVIISKSGGLTVSESLAKALPMIIMKPIPGQETRNAEIIEEYGIGMRLYNVNDIGKYLEKMLENNRFLLEKMRKNARELARPESAKNISQWVIKTLLKSQN
ncbi:MAG: glycosyltransferase [Candidatus Omnitrophica bacterium]|nr:glycosyltransferase [Candidatus Omnitrophota bacterium]